MIHDYLKVFGHLRRTEVEFAIQRILRKVRLQHRVTAGAVVISLGYALAGIARRQRSHTAQSFKRIADRTGQIQSTIRHHRTLSQHVEFTRILNTIELIDVLPPDGVVAVEADDRGIRLRSDDPDSSGQIGVEIEQQCATQAGRRVIGVVQVQSRIGEVHSQTIYASDIS